MTLDRPVENSLVRGNASLIRRATIVLLVFGVLVRLAWSLNKIRQGLDMRVSGEAFDVARHIALGKGWAGAYGDDLPTAHLLLIPPAIAGGVYALWGSAHRRPSWYSGPG